MDCYWSHLCCFQLQLGGLVLHDGQVAEMRTGEGKTLVATLPAYVNALTGALVGSCTAWEPVWTSLGTAELAAAVCTGCGGLMQS